MSIKQGTLLGDTLDRMPARVARHLAYLQCGKIALTGAVFQNSGDDSWCGAHDAALGILSQVVDQPEELRKIGRFDGIFLSDSLFKPQDANLSPWESMVYQAALNTAEIQMRRLHDSDPNDFSTL